ncbi:TonB-dependent receptor plug domain-containing protein [Phenylobacterium montanum]|uniref:TonB-dependent receptor n=1 Tax=Phenylobacterium montanum TaxID=2823693 RepID=A0A975IU45_9CAUL|nr:TonB-dependent receptor [Caulobacter sp. S6]QUD87375.1 TonB-dependent receptor [Caulobacter sp. S6]
MKSALLSSSIIALATALAAPALAQTAPAPAAGADQASAEVIVTGTRQTGVKAVDSPAPIQLVGSAALKRVGQPDLMQALSQSLPSFNAQQYGADTAALTLSAALRGLNPNQTLVLVDGKRRHGTANLQVDGGSPYQGAATTDLSFIPVDAIDHVEVLQDGAAAQYGSDAIAGVVNFILKKQDHGGMVSGTAGEYYEGDGETAAWSLNKGLAIGDKGFFNFTAEEKVHSFSRQGTYDRRFNNPDGSFKNAGPQPIDNTNVPLTPGYPKMNNIYGDPEYQIYNVMYNAGYNITPDIQLYSFGSYGHRTDSGYENYRRPSRVKGCAGTPAAPGALDPNTPGKCLDGSNVIYPFKYGFSPREKFQEDDYSFTGGIKGTTLGWNWDVSSTYGKDHDLVYTINSANAELYADLQSINPTPIAPQRNFFDGSFDATEWTNNIDVSRDFNLGLLASPLNVALGGETRRNTFAIGAGESSSYYGGTGAQSFSGYSPLNAGGHARTSYAGYIDLAADVIKGLHVDLAGRYEHYSDFGDTTVGKVTARYDFNDMIAVRGTISTGFRAPTPQEEFYEGINVSPSFIQGQLPPNSAAAAIAGFQPLQPETSHNYSFGFVLHPVPRMQISADFYEIDIKSRIVGSAGLLGSQLVACPNPDAPVSCTAGSSYNVIVSQAIVNALASIGAVANGVSYTSIQLFTNGADTRTRGAEVTATYSSDFGDMGHVDWSAGFNYNETTLRHIAPLPAVDYNADPQFGQTALLLPTAIDALTTATPKYKIVLAAYWTKGPWAVNLREDVYGSVSQRESYNGAGTGAGLTNVKEGALGITDLDVSYKVTSNLRINMGANNLFDQRPISVPTVGGRPADGNNVFGEPIQFSPIGINGGYFYGRVTYTF